jgi:hypothetical protein
MEQVRNLEYTRRQTTPPSRYEPTVAWNKWWDKKSRSKGTTINRNKAQCPKRKE